jgi:hypothetical protein
LPTAVRETRIRPKENWFGNQPLHLIVEAADMPRIRQAVVDLDGEGQDHPLPLGEEFCQGEDRMLAYRALKGWVNAVKLSQGTLVMKIMWCLSPVERSGLARTEATRRSVSS